MKKPNLKISESQLIQEVIKLNWVIQEVNQPKSRRKKPDLNEIAYQVNDKFKFVCDSKKSISGITLCKPRKKPVHLSCFMGIKPTYLIKNGVVNIIFLIGSEPCNLYYLIFCCEHIDSKYPIFSFKISPVFENCKCDDKVHTAVLYSVASGGTGIGK